MNLAAQRTLLRLPSNHSCSSRTPVRHPLQSSRWKTYNIAQASWQLRAQAPEVEGVATDGPSTSGAPALRLDSVKAALLDAVFGTERGSFARSEVRAEVNELINQLEVQGGQSTDVSSLGFAGTWELLYTNASELVALIAINRLPLPVRIGAVTQRIDAGTSTVENSVQLQFPMIMTSLSTVATYDVASPKRLQFTVQRGVLHTPSIEGSLELPAAVTLLGQTLDVGPLRDALAPLTRGAASLAASASDLLGQAPNLEVPLAQVQAQGWQLTTYLDGDLRITRGDGGAVYVFRKVQPATL